METFLATEEVRTAAPTLSPFSTNAKTVDIHQYGREDIAEHLVAGVDLNIDWLILYERRGLSKMMGKNNLSNSPPPLNETKDLSTAVTMGADDCLDYMTCICILVPFDSVLHEEIELPLSRMTTSIPTSNYPPVHAHEDGQNSLSGKQTHMLATEPKTSGGYDLPAMVEDPPIHFPRTDRHLGTCPLGYQETIYFNAAPAV